MKKSKWTVGILICISPSNILFHILKFQFVTIIFCVIFNTFNILYHYLLNIILETSKVLQIWIRSRFLKIPNKQYLSFNIIKYIKSDGYLEFLSESIHVYDLLSPLPLKWALKSWRQMGFVTEQCSYMARESVPIN